MKKILLSVFFLVLGLSFGYIFRDVFLKNFINRQSLTASDPKDSKIKMLESEIDILKNNLNLKKPDLTFSSRSFYFDSLDKTQISAFVSSSAKIKNCIAESGGGFVGVVNQASLSDRLFIKTYLYQGERQVEVGQKRGFVKNTPLGLVINNITDPAPEVGTKVYINESNRLSYLGEVYEVKKLINSPFSDLYVSPAINLESINIINLYCDEY